MSILRTVKRRLQRWWNGPSNVTALDVVPFMYEKQMFEVIELGRAPNLSMELLDSYLNFRNEGNEPEEAKQLALREWDL